MRIPRIVAIVLVATAFASLSVAAPTDAQQSSSRVVIELAGDEVVPGPGDPDGRAALSLSITRSGMVCAFFQTRDVAVPFTGAHIHQGAAGTAGPEALTLIGGTTDPDPSACVEADRSLIKDLLRNPESYYVDIHNEEFPDGALRGQFAHRDSFFFVGLEGADVVPGPGDPDAVGAALLSIGRETGTLCFQVDLSNVAVPLTGGHIHAAPAGTVGPEAVVLFGSTSDNDPFGCLEVASDLLRDFAKKPENYYVDVHNEEFPDGAVRGQLG